MAHLDRQSRLTILSLALGAFAIGVAEFAAMGLLPFYAADLGVSEPEAAHAVSAYAIGVVVGAPVLAALASYMPRKGFLILLISLFGLANILSVAATGIGTLVASRFLAGLPHGAFLGISMLAAAALAPEGRKAEGVAQILMGLTIANIIGVPVAGAVGQTFGWRWCFGIVAVLAACSALMIARVAPADQGGTAPNPMRELRALANRAVWLTLMVSAVGFGAVFAVYAFFSAAMISSAMAPGWAIPLALSGFGVGATLGNVIAGRLANWSHFGGTLVLLLGMVVCTLLYASVMGHWIAMSASLALLGCTAGLVIPLQMRLIAVAGDAQTLAAALNHAAFNAANALGPWVAGRALDAGFGWASTGVTGAALALGGIAVLALAWMDDRRGPQAVPVPTGC